jgi:peptidoglycan-associated lipoprotein
MKAETMNKHLAIVLALPVFSLAVACGGDEKKPPQTPPPQPTATTTTTTAAPKPEQMAVNVDSDIVKACNLKFTNVEDAPKFDFDSDELTPAEKDVLSQIAKCLSTGPLKGRSVDLVGRADPRGETEYNMTRGAKRARHVHNFMGSQGVASDKMHDTSRGELDATGTDEAGWRRDRRVDVKLRQ